jgi:hypothetical protein
MRVRTALLCLGLAAPALAADEQRPSLLDGMGSYRRDVGTSEQAQRFFDQGLVLAYGFNHAAAEQAFREAARLDPACAMCFWGIALVLGPHINAAMEASAVSPAWEASQEAKRLSKNAKPADRALIEALTKRYSPMPGAERAALDQAYADAMRDIGIRYPDDADVQTLTAEALMDLHPWDLWEKSGAEKPWTRVITARLERALARPDHPGANHLHPRGRGLGEPQRAMAAPSLRVSARRGPPAHAAHASSARAATGTPSREPARHRRRSQERSRLVPRSLYALGYVPHNASSCGCRPRLRAPAASPWTPRARPPRAWT